MLDPDPQTYIARYQNEKLIEQAGRAVDLADRMLGRAGFIELKDQAWTEQDRRVIRLGLEAYRMAQQHVRN